MTTGGASGSLTFSCLGAAGADPPPKKKRIGCAGLPESSKKRVRIRESDGISPARKANPLQFMGDKVKEVLTATREGEDKPCVRKLERMPWVRDEFRGGKAIHRAAHEEEFRRADDVTRFNVRANVFIECTRLREPLVEFGHLVKGLHRSARGRGFSNPAIAGSRKPIRTFGFGWSRRSVLAPAIIPAISASAIMRAASAA